MANGKNEEQDFVPNGPLFKFSSIGRVQGEARHNFFKKEAEMFLIVRGLPGSASGAFASSAGKVSDRFSCSARAPARS